MNNRTINEMTNGNLKHLQDVVADLKEEAKEFVNTRVAIFMAEIREKVQTVKMAAPLLIAGLLLLLTAWFLFTGFLVAIIAQAFLPSSWAYLISLVIVAVVYAIAGGGTAMFAVKAMSKNGVKPERTIHVLQQDRIWLQTEAKTQL